MGAFHYTKPTDQKISGNTRRKWNDIFRLNGNSNGPLPLFIPFPNSLIRAKNVLSKMER